MVGFRLNPKKSRAGPSLGYPVSGMELRAATISRWICTTMDSHAALQKIKSIPKTVKALNFVATLPQGRSTDGEEGQKMFQWRHLHVLLPQRPMPTS